MSRDEAFAKLESGELEGTMAGVELYTVKRLLNGSAESLTDPEVNPH